MLWKELILLIPPELRGFPEGFPVWAGSSLRWLASPCTQLSMLAAIARGSSLPEMEPSIPCQAHAFPFCVYTRQSQKTLQYLRSSLPFCCESWYRLSHSALLYVAPDRTRIVLLIDSPATSVHSLLLQAFLNEPGLFGACCILTQITLRHLLIRLHKVGTRWLIVPGHLA